MKKYSRNTKKSVQEKRKETDFLKMFIPSKVFFRLQKPCFKILILGWGNFDF